jgi:hypothetical protein
MPIRGISTTAITPNGATRGLIDIFVPSNVRGNGLPEIMDGEQERRLHQRKLLSKIQVAGATNPGQKEERRLNRVIITLKGKARQVFKLFDLYCKGRGAVTLGELAGK